MMDIQRILEENQRAIEGEKRAEFERFRSLLLNYNEKYNLTAITEEKDVFYKHFLDSSAGSGVYAAFRERNTGSENPYAKGHCSESGIAGYPEKCRKSKLCRPKRRRG